MTKPVVAIDCDDVIIQTAPNILHHYNITYNTNISLKDYYTHSEVLWGTDHKTFLSRIHKYLDSDGYRQLQPFNDAIDAIKKLSEKYELHIVTARPDILTNTTEQMVSKYFPDVFNSVIFTNHSSINQRSKADICNQLNADYLIEDSLHHAEVAASQGISVLLFGNYPWNQAHDLPDNIKRVNDWRQVRNILLDKL